MFRKDATFDQSLFDINELVREAVHVLRKEIDGLRVTVQLDLASQLPMVSGHRSQLGQVILNLIKNATDAMSPVSNRPRILALRTEAHVVDSVVVSVADTGVGIDATLLDRIFDVFYSGKAEGMGMGLAISRSIIDAHGGRLWAESTRDLGSIFRFTLPQIPGV
jgi:signal transduction histidine kinase